MGPEEGVEEGLEVSEEEPEDEGGGADVAVGEVPEHRGRYEEDGEEGEGGEEDGCRVGLGWGVHRCGLGFGLVRAGVGVLP